MKTLAVVVLLASLSAIAHAEDMQKYLRDTQSMVKEGKYQEALDRFLWFDAHALEHEPGMEGVRVSFALSSWKQLADVYSPALDALKKLRDDKTALLEAGQGNARLFGDVMALNRTIDENRKTIDLFRKLDQQHHELATSCWIFAEETVLEAKAYDLAKKYLGNPVREFAKVKGMYEINISMYDEKRFGEQFKSYNENDFVKKTIRLIDFAVAVNDSEIANEIQKKALAVLDDNRLRDAVR